MNEERTTEEEKLHIMEGNDIFLSQYVKYQLILMKFNLKKHSCEKRSLIISTGKWMKSKIMVSFFSEWNY